jgi:hypothetical protein
VVWCGVNFNTQIPTKLLQNQQFKCIFNTDVPCGTNTRRTGHVGSKLGSRGAVRNSTPTLFLDPFTRMKNMSRNLTMLTAGGRICCRQCQALSKRTRLQCRAPAIRGKDVCRTHGGLSTGPKTEQGRQRCAESRTAHGNETRAKRAERSRKSAELHQLVGLGNAIGLFNSKVALRGRRPERS